MPGYVGEHKRRKTSVPRRPYTFHRTDTQRVDVLCVFGTEGRDRVPSIGDVIITIGLSRIGGDGAHSCVPMGMNGLSTTELPIIGLQLRLTFTHLDFSSCLYVCFVINAQTARAGTRIAHASATRGENFMFSRGRQGGGDEAIAGFVRASGGDLLHRSVPRSTLKSLGIKSAQGPRTDQDQRKFKKRVRSCQPTILRTHLKEVGDLAQHVLRNVPQRRHVVEPWVLVRHRENFLVQTLLVLYAKIERIIRTK